ncbi:DUF3800 domain-containing protein [Actibacterium sp. MT2.3-13A]|uniref:DUF3800 domain-containing protein n=1 Tax=Actibacterium sp. MT2.3-13A TaxID=2828332 RepID=UPI001BA443A8|nr:DUF3800 domain-containing protein [Actibacterium sp. MT2.3-13A]
MTCSVFIDESGEAGIAKVRSDTSGGASPYFVLAAAVMPRAVKISATSVLDEVLKTIPKKWSHATELNHYQTVFWARTATKVNLRFFAVISNKSTLGSYSERIRKDPDKFYNKCAVYLLERVGQYLTAKGMAGTPPEVCFEKKNHDYDAMRRYLSAIKEKPMHTDAKYLRVFNPFAITAKTKTEEPLLRYADLAAHAAYQCANKTKTNFNIPEPRYLEELANRFGADERGNVIGRGIKCIHSVEDLCLDADVARKLRSLKAMPMQPVKR